MRDKNNLSDKNDSRWLPSVTLQNNITQDKWCASGKSDTIKNLVELCKKDLVVFYNELMNYLSTYNSLKAVLKNIYSIALLNELIKNIQRYKKENNLEHISTFNRKINKIVTQQPSPYIYERLGERYTHFLIDEFQDTSLLQWQNILPLITDSLDYGESLIVGDGKQSIY